MKEFTDKYYELLNTTYAGINLTRINDFEEFENKQIVDSIRPYEEAKIFKDLLDDKKILVDVGFGGGFPILPLANKLPQCKFFGIETRNKKVTTVTKIADELGLKNIKLIHNRLENVNIDMNVVMTLKAVGKVHDFLSKINCKKTIEVYFYKGPNFYELEKDQLIEAKKDWDIIEEIKLNIPGTEERNFIGFRNKRPVKSTNSTNLLVNLSSFN
jgi:16S rRNA (guanine527-N7)-methyltransferase